MRKSQYIFCKIPVKDITQFFSHKEHGETKGEEWLSDTSRFFPLFVIK